MDKQFNPASFPMLLNARQVEELAGIGRTRVYQLLNRADMPVVKLGRRKYMHRDLFLAWLSSSAMSDEVFQ